MITKKNPSMNSTAEEIYIANADSDIAEQCRIREDNIMHEKITNERLEALTKENALMAEEIIRLKKKLADNGID
jgi:hypothetical protein